MKWTNSWEEIQKLNLQSLLVTWSGFLYISFTSNRNLNTLTDFFLLLKKSVMIIRKKAFQINLFTKIVILHISRHKKFIKSLICRIHKIWKDSHDIFPSPSLKSNPFMWSQVNRKWCISIRKCTSIKAYYKFIHTESLYPINVLNERRNNTLLALRFDCISETDL